MKAHIYIIAILFLLSCKNNTENNQPIVNYNNYKDSVDNSFRELSKNIFLEKQTFLISKSNYLINGEYGTKVNFNKDCFKSDTVLIELQEFYDMPRMILNQLNTTSDGLLLETDGMIFIEAKTKFGTKINLQNKCDITFPTKRKKKSIQIFEGKINDSIINWKLSNEKILPEKVITVSNHKGGESEQIAKTHNTFKSLVYKTKLNNFGWINCDRFIQSKKNSIDINIELGSDKVKTYYSLVFYNYNSIIGKFVFDGDSTLTYKDIPKRTKATLIGLAMKGNEVYYSLDDFYFTDSSQKYNVSNLIKIEKDKLKEILQSKFGNDLVNRPKPNF